MKLIKFLLIFFLLTILIASDNPYSKKTEYPLINDSAMPQSKLTIENPFKSKFTNNMTFDIKIEIDGFYLQKNNADIPVGTTSFNIKPGSHEIIIRPLISNKRYFYYPVYISCYTEPNKEYKLILTPYGKSQSRKFGFKILYEGWPEEVTASWPFEIYIGN